MKGTEPVDELILKVLGGEASPEESERVSRWCGEAPENQARYDAVRRVWMTTVPAPLPGEVDLSVVPRIVRAAAEREEQAVATGPTRFRPGPVVRWALPLAAALGAVSLGVHLWSGTPGSSVVLEATGGASETFVLDDGSFVRLARGSRLEQGRDGGERRVQLEGRALFAVAHDEERPFIVESDGVETRVLGTRFEVRPLPGGEQRVTVLEGRVEVRTPDGWVELGAGEVSVASPGLPPTRSMAGDVMELLDWAEGTLLFQSTPLAQVAREVGRWYGAEVVVEGEVLQDTRISAWYGAEPFRDVIQSLCAATGATCTVSDTLAVLR